MSNIERAKKHYAEMAEEAEGINRPKYASDQDVYAMAVEMYDEMDRADSPIQISLINLSREVALAKEAAAKLAATVGPALRGGLRELHDSEKKPTPPMPQSVQLESDLAANLEGISAAVRDMAAFLRNVAGMVDL